MHTDKKKTPFILAKETYSIDRLIDLLTHRNHERYRERERERERARARERESERARERERETERARKRERDCLCVSSLSLHTVDTLY